MTRFDGPRLHVKPWPLEVAENRVMGFGGDPDVNIDRSPNPLHPYL